VLEHPDGYVVFAYKPGPRQLSDLQALLRHTRNLFERRPRDGASGERSGQVFGPNRNVREPCTAAL
jgi:hypothetical protein